MRPFLLFVLELAGMTKNQLAVGIKNTDSFFDESVFYWAAKL
jgi:hypothetical protein